MASKRCAIYRELYVSPDIKRFLTKRARREVGENIYRLSVNY